VSVTAAGGFRAAGVVAGLKASGRSDLALVVNDGPAAAAAGVFTRNRVQAAPVRWSREVLAGARVRAVLLNSGGANACTGPAGFQDAHRSAETVARALGVSAGEVALCSTGLIGTRLKMSALLTGIEKAAARLSASGGDDAATAIMTTDTVPKTAVRTGTGYTVGGMAKGAGMLAPALATMLAVLTTDADVDASTLDHVLRAAVRATFERVDVDGCLSTNDTVLLLANGASGTVPDPAEFADVVRQTCAELAGQLVDDAEGATKRINLLVRGAVDEGGALDVARRIAGNALFKCAVFGEDPNWGRAMAALGTSRTPFDPDVVDILFNGVPVALGSVSTGLEEEARAALRRREIEVVVDLHAGTATAAVLTTDLSVQYVHENSAYST
jgi:glutamate N-acetyltransferase/amino-acid N-acetyltransferase